METPKNIAGELTEKIMLLFSRWSDNPILTLEKEEYNKTYCAVYRILEDELVKDQYINYKSLAKVKGDQTK